MPTINACDAGREGELIFRLIVQYAGGAKGKIDKPIQRLWLQSMTPQAIRDGFGALRSDEQMHGLADAARSRSEADWLVGINGTRAMTAFNSRDGGFFLTTVGRVQTPTLAIVVEREEQIRKFVSRDYWRSCRFGRRRRVPRQVVRPGLQGRRRRSRADRLWDKAKADAIAAAVLGKPGKVCGNRSRARRQAVAVRPDEPAARASGRFGSPRTALSSRSAVRKHWCSYRGRTRAAETTSRSSGR